MTNTTSQGDWEPFIPDNAKEYYHPHNDGWKCPSCGRVYAPWVRQCPCRHSYWRPQPWPWQWPYQPYWTYYPITTGGVTVSYR